MRHPIETAPKAVIIDGSHARRGFVICWIAPTLLTAALVGICLHAEVVTYVARYVSQQEISKLITIVPQAIAQQTPLPKDDEAARLKQAVESATAELRQSLQQEHDRVEALATELAKVRRAMEQKPAAVEERPGVSLPAWTNSYAFVKPAQTAVQPDVAKENSKSAIKPGEPVRVEHKPRGGYGCQQFRTYNPASGTYMGYDGRRHSCP
jgi:BA14K-like protein